MRRLVGGLVLALGVAGSVVAQTRPGSGGAVAEAVLQRLQAVPAFVLADSAGSPFLVANRNGGQQVVAYLRKKLAEAAIADVRRSDPAMARRLVVRSVPLAELFRRFGAGGPTLAMVPDPEEVLNAQRRLVALGAEKPLEGVPLFVAKAQGKGYLNVTQNGRTFVPVFFSLSELEQLQAQVHAQSGNAAGSAVATSVDVLSLELLLARWKGTRDPTLGSVTLVPSAKALAEVKP